MNMFTAPTNLTPRNSTYPFIDPSRHAGKLSDKVALVTGAGRGLGRETALALAAAGARVVCVARSIEFVEQVAKEINQDSAHPPIAIGVSADVTKAESPERVAARIQQVWGKSVHVDILVCAAGVTRFQLFEKEAPNLKGWWRVFEINVFGTASFVRAVLPGMRSRGSGTIISFASTSGSLDIPFNTAYASSKSAIIKFNQDLHVELKGSGVNCFALHPGSVATDLGTSEGAVDMKSIQGSKDMQNVMAAFQECVKQTADLPANTCVALCVDNRARYLSGKYIDAQQDIGQVLDEAALENSRIERDNLYRLKLVEL